MNYHKKTVRDVDVKGKKVLLRCDFNVPMKNGVITDDNRIMGALPTIQYLMEHGAKVTGCMGGEYRMVCHHDISRADCETAASLVRTFAAEG